MREKNEETKLLNKIEIKLKKLKQRQKRETVLTFTETGGGVDGVNFRLLTGSWDNCLCISEHPTMCANDRLFAQYGSHLTMTMTFSIN